MLSSSLRIFFEKEMKHKKTRKGPNKQWGSLNSGDELFDRWATFHSPFSLLFHLLESEELLPQIIIWTVHPKLGHLFFVF
jgi:hypothetical protein